MHISPLMKLKNVRLLLLTLLLVSPLLVLGLAGCATPDNEGLMDVPGSGGDTNAAAVLPRIAVGDTVTVTLNGIADENFQPLEKPVKEDGTITLPDIAGPIKTAGKTPGELEDAIHSLYVPKVYTHLNVTVKLSSDRVYFVRGEVKQPGRLIYTGPITVTKAITSAGDFTDFANHKNIVLIRSNGKRFPLNVDKILHGDDPDPPVYPGDQIEVKRKVF